MTQPDLHHVVERDGQYYLYFIADTTIVPMMSEDKRLRWVHVMDPWRFYCWATDNKAAVTEYVLRYR